MSYRNSLLFLTIFCLLAPGVAYSASPDNTRVWKPRTKSVAVFKNGLGFFVQQGEVETSDGWALGESVPPAAFGTFAVYSLTDKAVVDSIALGPGEIIEFNDRQYPDTPEARLEKLTPLNGLNLELSFTLKGRETKAAGKLVDVSDAFVILETEASSFAVRINDIKKIQILNLPMRLHVQTAQTTDAAQKDATQKAVDPKDAAQKDAPAAPKPPLSEKKTEKYLLGMSYLQKGIIWIPEYSLRIIDENNAELTLRGTVVNEAEDLIDTDMYLVVGAPHFMHTDFQSPFVVGQAIRSLGVNLAIASGSQIPSQMLSQSISNSMLNAAPQAIAPAEAQTIPVQRDNQSIENAVGQLPSLETAGGSDYTVYTCKGLTLRKGERAMLTLFTQKIQYSHVYRWDVSKQMEHALILKNSTSTAWTTGPCLATSQAQALTEDTLRYTPKGSSVELALAESINVGQGQLCREIDRKINAHSINNNSFDLVSLEGNIRLQNFEQKEINIVVTCPVIGKATEASDEGKISQDASELRLAERKSSIVWNITLKPGETKDLTYKFERYVRAM